MPTITRPTFLLSILAVTLLLASGVTMAETTGERSAAGHLTVTFIPTTGLTVGDRVEARLILAWTGPEPAAPPRFPTWGETYGTSNATLQLN